MTFLGASLSLSGIAKSSWGTPYRYTRPLFQAVIASQMDYGSVVGHKPKADESTAGLA